MGLVPAIILIIVAVIAGYGLGIVDSRVTSALKQKVDEAKDEKKKEEVAKSDEHAVLKVTVDLALKWHVDLDGARVEPESMTAEQRTRLVNTIVQIRPWIDAKPASAPVPAPVPPTPRVSPVSLASANAPTVPPPRVDAIRGVRSILQNEVKKVEQAPMSIVGMIDDVLQKQLAGTPLEEKGIRLEEGAGGEVMVYVGKISYSGIDAVPDAEIKTAIRTAIAAWEKK